MDDDADDREEDAQPPQRKRKKTQRADEPPAASSPPPRKKRATERTAEEEYESDGDGDQKTITPASSAGAHGASSSSLAGTGRGRGVQIEYAFDTVTREFVHIDAAERGYTGRYRCIGCGGDAMLGAKKGPKNRHHFSHEKGTAEECTGWSGVTLAHLAVQLALKELLGGSENSGKENLTARLGYNLMVVRPRNRRGSEDSESGSDGGSLPSLPSSNTILDLIARRGSGREEGESDAAASIVPGDDWRVEIEGALPGGRCRGDVVVYDGDGRALLVIEVKNTHATDPSNRSGSGSGGDEYPWMEIDVNHREEDSSGSGSGSGSGGSLLLLPSYAEIVSSAAAAVTGRDGRSNSDGEGDGGILAAATGAVKRAILERCRLVDVRGVPPSYLSLLARPRRDMSGCNSEGEAKFPADTLSVFEEAPGAGKTWKTVNMTVPSFFTRIGDGGGARDQNFILLTPTHTQALAIREELEAAIRVVRAKREEDEAAADAWSEFDFSGDEGDPSSPSSVVFRECADDDDDKEGTTASSSSSSAYDPFCNFGDGVNPVDARRKAYYLRADHSASGRKLNILIATLDAWNYRLHTLCGGDAASFRFEQSPDTGAASFVDSNLRGRVVRWLKGGGGNTGRGRGCSSLPSFEFKTVFVSAGDGQTVVVFDEAQGVPCSNLGIISAFCAAEFGIRWVAVGDVFQSTLRVNNVLAWLATEASIRSAYAKALEIGGPVAVGCCEEGGDTFTKGDDEIRRFLRVLAYPPNRNIRRWSVRSRRITKYLNRVMRAVLDPAAVPELSALFTEYVTPLNDVKTEEEVDEDPDCLRVVETPGLPSPKRKDDLAAAISEYARKELVRICETRYGPSEGEDFPLPEDFWFIKLCVNTKGSKHILDAVRVALHRSLVDFYRTHGPAYFSRQQQQQPRTADDNFRAHRALELYEQVRGDDGRWPSELWFELHQSEGSQPICLDRSAHLGRITSVHAAQGHGRRHVVWLFPSAFELQCFSREDRAVATAAAMGGHDGGEVSSETVRKLSIASLVNVGLSRAKETLTILCDATDTFASAILIPAYHEEFFCGPCDIPPFSRDVKECVARELAAAVAHGGGEEGGEILPLLLPALEQKHEREWISPPLDVTGSGGGEEELSLQNLDYGHYVDFHHTVALSVFPIAIRRAYPTSWNLNAEWRDITRLKVEIVSHRQYTAIGKSGFLGKVQAARSDGEPPVTTFEIPDWGGLVSDGGCIAEFAAAVLHHALTRLDESSAEAIDLCEFEHYMLGHVFDTLNNVYERIISDLSVYGFFSSVFQGMRRDCRGGNGRSTVAALAQALLKIHTTVAPSPHRTDKTKGEDRCKCLELLCDRLLDGGSGKEERHGEGGGGSGGAHMMSLVLPIISETPTAFHRIVKNLTAAFNSAEIGEELARVFPAMAGTTDDLNMLLQFRADNTKGDLFSADGSKRKKSLDPSLRARINYWFVGTRATAKTRDVSSSSPSSSPPAASSTLPLTVVFASAGIVSATKEKELREELSLMIAGIVLNPYKTWKGEVLFEKGAVAIFLFGWNRRRGCCVFACPDAEAFRATVGYSLLSPSSSSPSPSSTYPPLFVAIQEFMLQQYRGLASRLEYQCRRLDAQKQRGGGGKDAATAATAATVDSVITKELEDNAPEILLEFYKVKCRVGKWRRYTVKEREKLEGKFMKDVRKYWNGDLAAVAWDIVRRTRESTGMDPPEPPEI